MKSPVARETTFRPERAKLEVDNQWNSEPNRA
jgi:hypothetical protein